MAFTFFFRDRETLDLLVELVYPKLWHFPKIRVWDAGCASGEEPFSVLLHFAELPDPYALPKLRIDATDHEESRFPQFERRLQAGIYKRSELESVSRSLLEKHFRPADQPGHFQIEESLRAHVHFQKHDLLSEVEIGNDFALVVCKNVMVHFSPQAQAGVVRMFHRALLPGGYLAFDTGQALPDGTAGLFEPITPFAKIFRKAG
jgi:chemotaxis protein methyltransferase CheR